MAALARIEIGWVSSREMGVEPKGATYGDAIIAAIAFALAGKYRAVREKSHRPREPRLPFDD
jgi:hypothetical protein